jgi:prepilin-type N-terminal cleavage/methylation domain-containing protein
MKKTYPNTSTFPPSRLGKAPLWRDDGCLLPSAFTLVELLIVMVLMAIIVGMAVPAFLGIGRGAGMRGGVSSVCSTLSLLRQWAITHREEVSFAYFAATSPTPSYYYATNYSGLAIISTNDPPTLPMDVKFLSNGIITFKTDGGLATGITPVELIIADRQKYDTDNTQKKTISVNGLTGAIRVK